VKLHVEVAGDGPPLVLLHGFTGSTATWRPYRERLAGRFRLVAIDLPGHGRSPLPIAGLVAVAEDLVAVVDRLGIARAHWLGYSLGGRAALHVVVAHPARVERLVLEGASPGIADSAERNARRAADEELATSVGRERLPAFVDRWMAQPLFASQARLGPERLAYERAHRLRGSPASFAAALRCLGTGAQAPLWAALAAVAAPTLLVVGAEDTRYRAIAEEMAARMPRGAIAVVPRSGHAAHLENPDAFWAAVCAFLALGRDVTESREESR
jgi:2-succinyl-6-hydroxy-2,4-cyclohexadiene-1-carboxylate synthase